MITYWRRVDVTTMGDEKPRCVWVPMPRIAFENRAGLDPRRAAKAAADAAQPERASLRYKKPLALHWGVGLVDLIGVVDVTSDPVIQAASINFYEIGPLWGAWPWSSAPAACPEAAVAADRLRQEIRAAVARAADESGERIRASVRAGHFG